MLFNQVISRFICAILMVFTETAFSVLAFAEVLENETSPASKSSPIVERIDTAVFANAAGISRPKISPDGQRILFKEKIKGKSFLTATKLDKLERNRVALPEKADLNWYRWAGSEKILFGVVVTKSFRGVERRQSVIYTSNLKTGVIQYLGRKVQAYDGDNVLFVDPEGDYLLLSVQNSIYDYPSIYRVEIDTNKLTTVVRQQNRIWSWIADNSGVVRMGISFRQNAIIIYYRRNADEKFRRISKIKENDDADKALLEIAHIVSEADEGYVLSNKETGRFALYKFNYLTREIGDLIFSHDENDVTGFNLNNEGTKLESVYYADSRDRIKWYDESFARHQRMLDKALPGQEAWIQSKSRDGKRMMIFSTSSTDPGSYYLYEPEEKKMIRFAGVNDRLDPAKLSDTKYVKYDARDGLTIPAYLTLPKGREPENLPLIILPHGGPYGVRDKLDFNTEVQLLANRGYAVLQPNFRGSESYGEGFYEKGEGEIGRAMQDDLDDGMDWLVKSGTVDPDKVCIVGASYGGYAALWGVTRNPERYRCAASFAGVTDLKKQLKYDGKFLKSRFKREWKETVRGEDDFDLDSVSPVRLARQLTRPILLAHGEEDSVVPFNQYKMYKKALKDNKHLVEYITYKKEGHGFDDPANEKDWLDRLDSFLARHNPAY